MPELPEVETIVRGLQGPVVGQTFTGAEFFWPNTLKTALADFVAQLPGQQVQTLTRRAKYLWFGLSGGLNLFIHLKMSGSLAVLPAAEPLHPHVRAVFHLANGYQLRFKDMRKFGRVYLVSDPAAVIGGLGPEPLADAFTPAAFLALMQTRRGRLKPLLLNQTFIAGIGNIYADESCFLAQIDPRRPAETLTPDEIVRLYHAIRQALSHGIMLKGASFDDVYRGGEYQNQFQVYGRTNRPCLTCGTPIRRVVLGGRSTHFCPRCQPES